MRLDKLPEFARPYKTKGFDVRLVGNSYQLFKISSQRVPGKKYPQLKQEYVGVIDPERGLIPSRKSTGTTSDKPSPMVEYGLSDFILTHFKRDLSRLQFNDPNKMQFIVLSIIHFIYGHTSERFIKLSYLSRLYEPTEKINGELKSNKVVRLSSRIATFMAQMFPDAEDRDYLITLLRDCKVSVDDPKPTISYSPEILSILDKYKVQHA